MESDLLKQKIEKLNALRAAGYEPYGGRFDKSEYISELIAGFREGIKVKTAGRVMAKRRHGKSIFADLKDQTAKVQLYMKKDAIGDESFDIFEKLDIGDIIGVEGVLLKTRTGEITINIEKFIILCKSIRSLPEKWHGLKDIETRYRQRYVDLIMNDKVKDVFKARTAIVSRIRRFLDEKDYLEVETPMMQPIPGGAAGNPFKTHHQALNTDLYLRIAPELYLKKLLVGGFEKVYEVNRNFRNEGISPRHNPEFTMLEVYTAYGDCASTMKLTEELITCVAKDVLGKTKFEYQGQEIDLAKWERQSFAELMDEAFGIRPDEDEKEWIKKLKKKGINIEGKTLSRTQVINIVGDLIEPKAKGHPVFVTDLFTELCPLAKTKKDNPLLTDRFELYMGGMEIANAYSELNDPQEQLKRFKEQVKGTEESIDEDFVRALEYGMPPAGGLGIGVDRLVMVLTDSPSIRDVILFPQLKPEK